MEDTPDKDELTKNFVSQSSRDIDVSGHEDAFSKSLAAAKESLEARKKDTLLHKVMAFLADKLGGILKVKKEKNAELFTPELFEKQAEKISQSPIVDNTMWSRAQKQLNEKLGQA
jgi:hypothetical protein